MPCQKAKISRHIRNVPAHIPVPDERFQHIHLDLIGPLPPLQGFKYCLTIVDRFSRWPEAIPVTDITADTIARAFYAEWVARYQISITTDQGRQFESELFVALIRLIGCKRIRTSPYHPASNGMVERWHRSLKTALMCHGHGGNWKEYLPSVLLGLRACYKEDLKCSAAELLFGTTLRLPGEFFDNGDTSTDVTSFAYILRERIRRLRAKPTTHHTRSISLVHKEMDTCTHVFVRDDAVRKPLQQPYKGRNR